MARKKNNYPLIESLEITALAAEGKAVGRYNDMVVFVPLCVVGDVVDVQVRVKRRRFMEGYVTRWVRRSPMRVEPFCEHFGVCGGCKWQHIPCEEQLRQKRQQVVDQLERIARVELPDVAPCLASERTTHYRNKLEYTFAHRRWLTQQEIAAKGEIVAGPALGFHIPGMFDKVLDVRRCWLQQEPSNAIRLAVRRFCIEHGYGFHNAREHTGLMRNLMVRTASTGEVMVVVVFALDDRERIGALMEMLAEGFPQITSLMYIVNPKLNDSVGDLDAHLWSGRDHIYEQMEGDSTPDGGEAPPHPDFTSGEALPRPPLRFRIGPKSFYQTNSEQAFNLYKVARDFADLTGDETVYDLYTGAGTIACFVASRCRRVIGIEYVPEAIEDARLNAALNGIENASFHAGDMKAVLTDGFMEAHGHPDVMILDPPRAGVDEEVARTILRAEPRTIVYVSCNPATQARDIALLDEKYRLVAVQPVDMFPHTHHVENVVKMVRRQ
ncbi:MAG: 23S rRNA (uracil(1939)-C(5))-methyltransferase RlmD [Rikenellaceae bacterium]|jgi:23S rRNA (uracil1939-C5)-methyltransferase|nr:23S rRNA (uracil(1939)-C(5))-methyltransferase RlmD [Rikenellaceae bacterium]